MEEKQLVSLYINAKQIFRNGFEITYDFKLKYMKGFFSDHGKNFVSSAR